MKNLTEKLGIGLVIFSSLALESCNKDSNPSKITGNATREEKTTLESLTNPFCGDYKVLKESHDKERWDDRSSPRINYLIHITPTLFKSEWIENKVTAMVMDFSTKPNSSNSNGANWQITGGNIGQDIHYNLRGRSGLKWERIDLTDNKDGTYEIHVVPSEGFIDYFYNVKKEK